MKKLTPEEALNLVDQALSKITADRQTHAVLQESMQILSEAIKNTKKK